MNRGISDPWEAITMKVGDLVTLTNNHHRTHTPVGVVIGVRRPLAKGAQWYYLVKWAHDKLDTCYCSSGIIRKLI